MESSSRMKAWVAEELHKPKQEFDAAPERRRRAILERTLKELSDAYDEEMGTTDIARRSRDSVVLAAKAYIVGEWTAAETAEFLDKVSFLHAHEEVNGAAGEQHIQTD